MKISARKIAPLVAAAIALTALTRPVVGQDLGATKKEFAIPHVLEALTAAIDQPVPAGLNDVDRKGYDAHTEWLKTVRSRVEALGVDAGVVVPRDRATGQATGRMHPPRLITKDLGRLQATIETEGRQFNTLSNASKARHDIAMNAIRNMKG